MATTYAYQRIQDTLTYSRDHFEEAQPLFGAGDNANETLDDLKTRWQTVLAQGSEMAQWVTNRHRAQSPSVLAALEEMAKYADVRRPFRLSVIGQKGVGKSALVNTLLGAAGNVQYTPSDVTGKAVSGTRIRLIAQNPASLESQPTWRVRFLTPRRLWEVGSFLLTVARQPVPTAPADLSSREVVVASLKKTLAKAKVSQDTAPLGSANQIQADAARQMLERMLQTYVQHADLMTTDYSLTLDEPEVDGPISSYIRQNDDDLYLIVDYVERYLLPHQAGFLAGRPIELEDVLGLDDPRDSFFALEAFRESFAVVMVFKCDRGLGTEASSILQSLFSRDEAELARFGEVADLNKAIIVANRFDEIVSNVAPTSQGNPLKGIDDIRLELAKYTRQAQHVPIYLTSASIAQTAHEALAPASKNAFRPTSAYSSYLQGLVNLLQVVGERSVRTGQPAPDYLEPILSRRAELEAAVAQPNTDHAQLILDMSGLPRLIARVNEALESGSILRGRVANAEYYYSQVIAQTALCYARQMQAYRLDLTEFSQPPVNLESRLFARFQYETRQHLEGVDDKFGQEWFALSQRYIHGPQSEEVEAVRNTFLETIRRVVMENRQLVQVEQSISTGQMVTDAWRKVFEDINDWLVLEGGRQMRSLVGPMLADIEVVVGTLQKQLAEYASGPLDATFWESFRKRLDRLRERLQAHAEALAIGCLTDYRFSVYDETVAQVLHVGDDQRRREEVIYLLQNKVRDWFDRLHQLVAKVSMTDLNAFVNAVRYYVLGLPAEGSLLVGLEVNLPGTAQLAPDTSLTAILNHRYTTDEAFRRQYAMREPSPVERLTAEIRGWLLLIYPPLDGLAELGQAVAKATTTHVEEEAEADDAPTPEPGPTQPKAQINPAHSLSSTPGYTRLRVPIESIHPYARTTRQYWDITNPDEKATSTRLHFSKIDLGAGNGSPDALVIEALGGKQTQVVSGQHTDFWTNPLPGRNVRVRFNTNSVQPGWGFSLDGVGSGDVPAVVVVG